MSAQEARPRPAASTRINDARILVEGKDFTEALSILRPLAADRPEGSQQVDVLFLVGLAALGAAQQPETPESEQKTYLDEAIGAFHRILVARPELVRVRLELARAFYLKGKDGLSRREFERVLAENPPPPVAANIRRFLAAIRERRRWSGYLGMTLAPDTNINAATDAEVISPAHGPFKGLPFELGEDARARSGLGVVLGGGGEHEHPLSRHARLRTGGGASRTEYEGRDLDQTFLHAHGGLLWLAGRKTEISVLGSARRSWSGGEPQFHDLGARLETSHVLSRRVLLRTQASWHQRTHDEDRHLDGPRNDFSLTGFWQATPTTRLEATVGLAQEQTERRWRNNTQSVELGTSVDLPYGFTVGLNGKYRWTNHEGQGNWGLFTPPGELRSDQTRTLSFSLYNRGWTLQGFSPKLVLTRETRESNTQVRDYQRTRGELQFVRVL